MFLAMALISIFPQIALWLPNQMMVWRRRSIRG
jgi:hypothetical protein